MLLVVVWGAARAEDIPAPGDASPANPPTNPSASGIADPSAAHQPPAQRWVLLHGGGLLEGHVVEEPLRLVIRCEGGELRVDRAQVIAVVASIEEAYGQLRSRTATDNAHQQLDLVQWCLRQRLFDEAETHLAAARALQPRSPRVQRLARVIELARQPVAPTSYRVSVAPVPGGDSATGRGTADDGPPLSVPVEAMEAFVRDIQPLVLNSCATGSCHGARSANGLKLNRQNEGRQNTRRNTHRNLEGLLRQVDRQVPESSPLLTTLRQPHGGRAGAVVSLEQYRLIEAWVGLLAARDNRSPRGPGRDRPRRGIASPARGGDLPPENPASGTLAERLLAVQPELSGDRLSPSDEEPHMAAHDGQEVGSADHAASDRGAAGEPLEEAVAPPSAEPGPGDDQALADDPEEFNRQYHSEP